MKQTIPSSFVGLKINEWYTHIRQFHVADAERVKLEVEREIEDMEEDQDLLLYYSLMEFRHRVMLDYIKPLEGDASQLEFSELLEDIEGNQYTENVSERDDVLQTGRKKSCFCLG
jgi:response regulator aspartate phosphatase A (stage 0 sporulation protein L)